MIIVHYPIDTELTAEAVPKGRTRAKILDRAEPIPPGAVWIDMVEPTPEEDQKVERFLGCRVPSHADPDFVAAFRILLRRERGALPARERRQRG